MPETGRILTINGGSSTVRYACFQTRGERLERVGAGKVERSLEHDPGPVLERIDSEIGLNSLRAVGHRVVHGMDHTAPAAVTPALLDELRGYQSFDPEHLPREIHIMAALLERRPGLPQLACFDTAFHRQMPRIARLLPLPRRLAGRGVERYGFHGLSYTWLMAELRRLSPAEAEGRVILAHLGSGSSLAAVRGGQCVDTTMGFTPASGIPMGTRAGDLDAGLAAWLVTNGGMTPAAFSHMIHHEAGLLGVSETSADMRDLLAREGEDERAAEAIAMYCYHVRKAIGALAAVLGGVDTLVFSGGIGENAPEVRRRICEGLEFLGIAPDEGTNARGEAVIPARAARVAVRVIPTDEERIIAQAVLDWEAGNVGNEPE